MAAKNMGQRVGAIVLAVTFLFTSIGFSGLVIWQIHKDNQQKKTSENQANNQSEQQEAQGDTLAGTDLTDFTPVSKINELEKIDTKVGDGDEVKPGDTITAHYTGAVAATGKIFQSSLDSGQPVAFSLSGVIKGWTDGVPGMKVGGKRRLLIPAAQAYGANPPSGSNIPANADLVFDIELVKIGE